MLWIITGLFIFFVANLLGLFLVHGRRMSDKIIVILDIIGGTIWLVCILLGLGIFTKAEFSEPILDSTVQLGHITVEDNDFYVSVSSPDSYAYCYLNPKEDYPFYHFNILKNANVVIIEEPDRKTATLEKYKRNVTNDSIWSSHITAKGYTEYVFRIPPGTVYDNRTK